MVVVCINTSEIEINKVLIKSLNPPHPPKHTHKELVVKYLPSHDAFLLPEILVIVTGKTTVLIRSHFFRTFVMLSITRSESSREGMTYLLGGNTAAYLKSFKNI